MAEQVIDQYAPSSRFATRAEVDTFADVLGKLSLPSLRGSSVTDLRRRHAGDGDVTNGDDFVVRLAASRGDLQRLEGLASKTFSWNDHPGKWDKQFASVTTTKHQGADHKSAPFSCRIRCAINTGTIPIPGPCGTRCLSAQKALRVGRLILKPPRDMGYARPERRVKDNAPYHRGFASVDPMKMFKLGPYRLRLKI